MKTLLSLCFILFFVCTNSAADDVAVLDTDGDELKVGHRYYAVSTHWGVGGGGLMLSTYPNLKCAITVSQELRDIDYGIPMSFHPADSDETKIHVSKSLNVKFETTAAPCANSTVWKVGKLDPYTRARLIQIGGTLGNPGCETTENWFKIEKGSHQSAYKFVSNPNDVCGNVVDRYTLATRRALGEMPLVGSSGERALEVVFIKQHVSNCAKPYIAM